MKDDQILIRLETEQKQKWKEHAENSDQYRDMTNLIEQAVEDRISTDTQEYDVEQAILALQSDLEDIRGDIADIKDINERIEDVQATSLQVDQGIDQLENIMDASLETVMGELEDE